MHKFRWSHISVPLPLHNDIDKTTHVEMSDTQKGRHIAGHIIMYDPYLSLKIH